MEHRQEHKWDLGRSALFGSCASTVAAQWQWFFSPGDCSDVSTCYWPRCHSDRNSLVFNFACRFYHVRSLRGTGLFQGDDRTTGNFDPSTSSWSTEAFWWSVASNAASHAQLFQQSWAPFGVPVCCYSTLEADAASKLWTLLWVDSLIDWIFWTYLYGRERDNESSFPICHIHIRLLSFPVFDGRCLGDEFSGVFVSREAPRRVPVSSGCCSDRFEGDFDVVH